MKPEPDTSENLGPPVKLLSERERKLARTDRQRHKTQTNRRPMSDKMRAYLMSPEHHAMLRENVRKYRESNGGKASNRAGVPDGWAGKSARKRRLEIIAVAEVKAGEVIDQLIENGVLKKDAAGNEILKWATSVVLAKDPQTKQPCHTIKDQLAAAKLVADYTLSKPEAKQALRLSSEDFLENLLAKTVPPQG